MSSATMRAAALSPFLAAGRRPPGPARPRGRARARGGRGLGGRGLRVAAHLLELARAGLQLVEVAAQALGARAQVDDELRHVALHLLDALAQAVGRGGDAGHVLAGLGVRRVADLLRAALGRLDDRLDLLAGLRRQRRRGGRLPAQVVDLVGDPVEVGVDRRRVVSPAIAGKVVAHDGLAIQGHGRLSLARSRPRPA